ncbi:MAG: hypothetical protein QNJ73_08905 [Gammaproteobacteria bacterium]|nr:hypothetical protein [Gammaproteobacteria bacterium]
MELPFGLNLKSNMDRKTFFAVGLLIAATLLVVAGYQSRQASILVVVAEGKMLEIPVDNEELQAQEAAFGPGGFLSDSPGAARHLEAVRAGHRAWNRQFIYYGAGAMAFIAGLWLLFSARSQRRMSA